MHEGPGDGGFTNNLLSITKSACITQRTMSNSTRNSALQVFFLCPGHRAKGTRSDLACMDAWLSRLVTFWLTWQTSAPTHTCVIPSRQAAILQQDKECNYGKQSASLFIVERCNLLRSELVYVPAQYHTETLATLRMSTIKAP